MAGEFEGISGLRRRLAASPYGDPYEEIDPEQLSPTALSRYRALLEQEQEPIPRPEDFPISRSQHLLGTALKAFAAPFVGAEEAAGRIEAAQQRPYREALQERAAAEAERTGQLGRLRELAQLEQPTPSERPMAVGGSVFLPETREFLTPPQAEKPEPLAERERAFRDIYPTWLQSENLGPNAANELRFRQEVLPKLMSTAAPREPNPITRVMGDRTFEYDFGSKQWVDVGPAPEGTAAFARAQVDENSKEIADAIASGIQPPVLTGLYRYGAPVRAELARLGYDLAEANRDWTAINRFLGTLNGPQQLRLRQAIDFTYHSLDMIEELYDEWKQLGGASGFRTFNSVALGLSKRVPGRMGEVGQALEAQVNDLISELGTVYRGGNTSTDEALRLAAENLDASWNEQQFKRQLALLRRTLQIRRNSIANAGVVGVTPTSPHLPPMAQPGEQPQGEVAPEGTVVEMQDGTFMIKRGGGWQPHEE